MRHTNWYVITGAPCSGKTSVICELERRGFQVVHEVARACIDRDLKNGKTPASIKADVPAFERRILHEKIRLESLLPDREIIFLDRAVPDSIAYYKLKGLPSGDVIKKSSAIRYKKIFFFERLRLKKDAVRTENTDQVARIARELESSYRRLGYALLRVPILPVRERADFILKQL
ncbi:MAG: ATP-binding protein [Deltaproteobacteria bacterium]|nr:ATP-binding protein [Deltaproteobacteria bacterium]